MNVIGSQDNPVSPEAWEEPDMRQAVAARDISTVYRLLRRVGISQRQIAALTGQSQSEVSEILKGRQVMAYDVWSVSPTASVSRGNTWAWPTAVRQRRAPSRNPAARLLRRKSR